MSRREIFWRGLGHRCPNCGAPALFRRWFTMNRECPCCGMAFERGEGFFLGSMTLNYSLTIVVYLLPIFILTLAGWLSLNVAIALALAGSILFPLAFYRSCRSWWLMIYFWFLPHELPANRRGASPDEDEA